MTISRDPDFSNTAEHHQGMADHAREDAAEELGLLWPNLQRATVLFSMMDARLRTWGLTSFEGDGRQILNLVADTIRASNSRKAE